MRSRKRTSIEESCPAGGELPEFAFIKEGQQFSPRDDVWTLYDGGCSSKLSFLPLQQYYSPDLLLWLKRYMVVLLRKQSLYSSENFFRGFTLLVRHASCRRGGLQVETLDKDDLLGYRATLEKHNEYRLLALRQRIIDWVDLGYGGIDPEVPALLKVMKLRPNETGQAVLNHDPQQGPFNDAEYGSIIQYVLDQYAGGIMDLSDLVLCFLFIIFGARPVSFAALRLKDVVISCNKYGIKEYRLLIPAAKRPRGGRRSNFHERTLTTEVGQIVEALLLRVKTDYQDRCNNDCLELPLFPGKDIANGYGVSAGDLSSRVARCFAGEGIPCLRPGLEGTKLRVAPKRFRHTVATRMAEEGKRQREIALALGHVSMSSARTYIEATAKIRHAINDKLRPETAPIAQHFLGELVYGEDEKGHAVNGQTVRSFEGALQGEVIGTCGKSGFCGGFVPLPCYSCRNFRAWIEAPHEEVLAWLMVERRKKLERTGDQTYAAINDQVITQVADVVRRCSSLRPRRIKGELNGPDPTF